jgi:hypothetical protein
MTNTVHNSNKRLCKSHWQGFTATATLVVGRFYGKNTAQTIKNTAEKHFRELNSNFILCELFLMSNKKKGSSHF